MADFFDELSNKHIDFISEQAFFTVATAPNEGRINISPKGLDCFRVIDNNTVAYLDTVGSANETAAHMLENGRITIIFMSFSRNALILRLYGKGQALQKKSAEFKSLISLFPETSGVRQIMLIKLDSVATSCGYGVPVMTEATTRKTLSNWTGSKSEEELKDYQRKNNLKSIDGLNTGLELED